MLPTICVTTVPPTALPDYLHPLSHGIYAVDSGFERDHFDSAYLIVQDNDAQVLKKHSELFRA